MDAGKKFDALVEMMESATVVVVDHDALVYPSVHNDENDEKMIELSWIDDDGSVYEHYFSANDLVELAISEDNEDVVLTHTSGEVYHFKPLTVDFDAVIKIGNELGKGSKPKL